MIELKLENYNLAGTIIKEKSSHKYWFSRGRRCYLTHLELRDYNVSHYRVAEHKRVLIWKSAAAFT